MASVMVPVLTAVCVGVAIILISGAFPGSPDQSRSPPEPTGSILSNSTFGTQSTTPNLTTPPLSSTSASDTALACGFTYPLPHSIVTGSFTVEGQCPAYHDGYIFLIIRNFDSDPENGEPGPWWIQCSTQIHSNGYFACSPFACHVDTEYEVAILFPNPGSYGLYEDWHDNDSASSKSDLPGSFELPGSSLIVRSASILTSAPAQCGLTSATPIK
jgi:hypothetical protein